ncbi:MAG: hypothetical protein R3E74_14820 [Pseudomonadales bacterium]
MSKEVIETYHGKYSKFEVVKDSGLMSTKFYVYKDGKFVSDHKSLSDAVDAAKKKAGK